MNFHSSKLFLCVNKIIHQNRCVQNYLGIQQVLRFHRPLCISSCHGAVTNSQLLENKEGVFRKAWNMFKYTVVQKSRMKICGYYLYESIADKISYFVFFKELNLPDTFNSWFIITELHVWMLMVKSMEYGEDGRHIRNFIVEAMWSDVTMKANKLGPEHSAVARSQIQILGDQFQAALIGYDEGLLSNDKVLASALWRRFFERSCTDPTALEAMVKYVRQQVLYLDNITEEDFKARKINWILFEKT